MFGTSFSSLFSSEGSYLLSYLRMYCSDSLFICSVWYLCLRAMRFLWWSVRAYCWFKCLKSESRKRLRVALDAVTMALDLPTKG